MVYAFWPQRGRQRIEDPLSRLSVHDNNIALNNIPSLSTALSTLWVSKTPKLTLRAKQELHE
jgi:hypothetical protein